MSTDNLELRPVQPRSSGLWATLGALGVCLLIGLGIGMYATPKPVIGVVRFADVIWTDTADRLIQVVEAARQDSQVAGVVLEISSPGGLATSSEKIYYTLLKLRQVCCDPRLLKTGNHGGVPSAKFELLMEMLAGMAENGRHVIVFSQFVEMLDLIEDALTKEGLAFVKLTGQTKDRETPVQRFQAGEVPIFLISLKAGGTGLTLTRADTVIHYDPWWNPAVENQATDRAHRIGQDKTVFVYKLIAEGTVEEKMVELQGKKQALVDSVLSGTGAGLSFTEEDIEALFAPLPD